GGGPFPPRAPLTGAPPGGGQRGRRGCSPAGGVRGGGRAATGPPGGWGSPRPPPRALWLVGRGLDVLWTPPRQPQRNGVVENSQGVGQRWAEPERCRDVAELQARLDEEDRGQREEDPHEAGRPRPQGHGGPARSRAR